MDDCPGVGPRGIWGDVKLVLGEDDLLIKGTDYYTGNEYDNLMFITVYLMASHDEDAMCKRNGVKTHIRDDLRVYVEDGIKSRCFHYLSKLTIKELCEISRVDAPTSEGSANYMIVTDYVVSMYLSGRLVLDDIREMIKLKLYSIGDVLRLSICFTLKHNCHDDVSSLVALVKNNTLHYFSPVMALLPYGREEHLDTLVADFGCDPGTEVATYIDIARRVSLDRVRDVVTWLKKHTTVRDMILRYTDDVTYIKSDIMAVLLTELRGESLGDTSNNINLNNWLTMMKDNQV